MFAWESTTKALRAACVAVGLVSNVVNGMLYLTPFYTLLLRQIGVTRSSITVIGNLELAAMGFG